MGWQTGLLLPAAMPFPLTWKGLSIGPGTTISDYFEMQAYSFPRTASGNMIYIEHTTDFEFYSGNSAGAIQGYGYEFAEGRPSTHCFVLIDNTDNLQMATMGQSIFRRRGILTEFSRPRLLRLYEVVDFSVHDFVLVDCKNLFRIQFILN